MRELTDAARAREARIRNEARGRRIRRALVRAVALVTVLVPIALVWLVVTVGLSMVLWSLVVDR